MYDFFEIDKMILFLVFLKKFCKLTWTLTGLLSQIIPCLSLLLSVNINVCFCTPGGYFPYIPFGFSNKDNEKCLFVVVIVMIFLYFIGIGTNLSLFFSMNKDD